MKRYVDALVREALIDAIEGGFLRARAVPGYTLDVPRYPAFGELACDVALVLARELAEQPHAIAAIVVACLRDRHGWLAGVDVGGPGFVNFRFAAPFWQTILADALAAEPASVRTGAAGGPVRVERFPGAPNLEDGRAAMVADAVTRMLEASGHDVATGDGAPCARVVGIVVAGRADQLAQLRSTRPAGAALRVLAVHPVRLTRDGEPVPAMGLDAVLAEAGADAVRFQLLLAPTDRAAELDLELAKLSRTDNPAFYAQYAHARLAGLLGRVPAVPDADLSMLGEGDREALRAVAAWPDVLEAAVEALEPQRIAAFAVELAATAHRWMNRHRIGGDTTSLVEGRVALARCLQQILSRALALCGVTAPDRM